MSNKLKIEDTCLTVEQSKELQSLGIEMKDTIMVFCDYYDQVHDYELCINWKGATDYVFEAVPTLTSHEMLEMLLKNIDNYHLEIIAVDNVPFVQYINEYNHIAEFKEMVGIDGELAHYKIIPVKFGGYNLCNALFNMIKFLKTNNLM